MEGAKGMPTTSGVITSARKRVSESQVSFQREEQTHCLDEVDRGHT